MPRTVKPAVSFHRDRICLSGGHDVLPQCTVWGKSQHNTPEGWAAKSFENIQYRWDTVKLNKSFHLYLCIPKLHVMSFCLILNACRSELLELLKKKKTFQSKEETLTSKQNMTYIFKSLMTLVCYRKHEQELMSWLKCIARTNVSSIYRRELQEKHV